MFKFGDMVQWSNEDTYGCVIMVTAREIKVAWEADEGTYTSTIPTDKLGQQHRNGRTLILVAREIETVQPITPHQFDRAMVMAKNIGRMEGTIEILFNRINRMRKVADLYGHVNTVADLDAMLETITRCAERIEDLPSVSGIPTVSQLKTYIASQK